MAALVDIHVYVIREEDWIAHRKLAENSAVVNDAVSAGFIRILPTVKLDEVRAEVHEQLGLDNVPITFVFLRSVGRNFTQVKPHQETDLKVKYFCPPFAAQPELYLKSGDYQEGDSAAQLDFEVAAATSTPLGPRSLAGDSRDSASGGEVAQQDDTAGVTRKSSTSSSSTSSKKEAQQRSPKSPATVGDDANRNGKHSTHDNNNNNNNSNKHDNDTKTLHDDDQEDADGDETSGPAGNLLSRDGRGGKKHSTNVGAAAPKVKKFSKHSTVSRAAPKKSVLQIQSNIKARRSKGGLSRNQEQRLGLTSDEERETDTFRETFNDIHETSVVDLRAAAFLNRSAPDLNSAGSDSSHFSYIGRKLNGAAKNLSTGRNRFGHSLHDLSGESVASHRERRSKYQSRVRPDDVDPSTVGGKSSTRRRIVFRKSRRSAWNHQLKSTGVVKSTRISLVSDSGESVKHFTGEQIATRYGRSVSASRRGQTSSKASMSLSIAVSVKEIGEVTTQTNASGDDGSDAKSGAPAEDVIRVEETPTHAALFDLDSHDDRPRSAKGDSSDDDDGNNNNKNNNNKNNSSSSSSNDRGQTPVVSSPISSVPILDSEGNEVGDIEAGVTSASSKGVQLVSEQVDAAAGQRAGLSESVENAKNVRKNGDAAFPSDLSPSVDEQQAARRVGDDNVESETPTTDTAGLANYESDVTIPAPEQTIEVNVETTPEGKFYDEESSKEEQSSEEFVLSAISERGESAPPTSDDMDAGGDGKSLGKNRHHAHPADEADEDPEVLFINDGNKMPQTFSVAPASRTPSAAGQRISAVSSSWAEISRWSSSASTQRVTTTTTTTTTRAASKGVASTGNVSRKNTPNASGRSSARPQESSKLCALKQRERALPPTERAKSATSDGARKSTRRSKPSPAIDSVETGSRSTTAQDPRPSMARSSHATKRAPLGSNSDRKLPSVGEPEVAVATLKSATLKSTATGLKTARAEASASEPESAKSPPTKVKSRNPGTSAPSSKAHSGRSSRLASNKSAHSPSSRQSIVANGKKTCAAEKNSQSPKSTSVGGFRTTSPKGARSTSPKSSRAPSAASEESSCSSSGKGGERSGSAIVREGTYVKDENSPPSPGLLESARAVVEKSVESAARCLGASLQYSANLSKDDSRSLTTSDDVETVVEATGRADSRLSSDTVIIEKEEELAKKLADEGSRTSPLVEAPDNNAASATGAANSAPEGSELRDVVAPDRRPADGTSPRDPSTAAADNTEHTAGGARRADEGRQVQKAKPHLVQVVEDPDLTGLRTPDSKATTLDDSMSLPNDSGHATEEDCRGSSPDIRATDITAAVSSESASSRRSSRTVERAPVNDDNNKNNNNNNNNNNSTAAPVVAPKTLAPSRKSPGRRNRSPPPPAKYLSCLKRSKSEGVSLSQLSHNDQSGSRVNSRASQGEGRLSRLQSKSVAEIEQHRREEMERLRAKFDTLRSERLGFEAQKEELVRHVRALQVKLAQEKEAVHEVWRKRYIEEKKLTPKLEEESAKWRQELERIHRDIITKVEGCDPGDARSPFSRLEEPSNKLSYKIMVARLLQEIEDLKRRLETTKLRLSAEAKLRAMAEKDVRSLREDLVQKKIQVTLTRKKTDSLIAPLYRDTIYSLHPLI